MTESNRIEYKRELSDGLEKEIVAFLNYHDGGIVYIGIDKNGQTIGVNNADALQLAIKDRIKNNIQPSALGLFAANMELLTEDGAYNYAAYLLADDNGNSTQIAKYAGSDRVDLIESKEYGYCCLVKTCKAVLDRLEGVENSIHTQITSRERIETPLWNPMALREAVINAIIHNDYSTELVPKFEIFSDRLEITSAGTIHPGREQEDFFAGYSMPRNKTLMRVFKDLGMVEYLGSGMPRILKAYPREEFTFSTRFIRLSMPMSEEAQTKSGVESGVESEMALQVMRLLMASPLSKAEIARAIGKKKPSRYLNDLMKKLLEAGQVAYTLPDKPQSRLQQYRLTEKGRSLLKSHGAENE